MPWTTPTLRTVRETVRGEITTSLGRASFVGNSVLRIMADAMAGMAHLVLRYIDWLSRQFLPDTAEHEWLDRHGDIWLVNADGSTGGKVATFASGSATITGVPGAIVPAASQLTSVDIDYETLTQIAVGTVATPVGIRALTPGLAGNLPIGSALSFAVKLPNVDDVAFVVELYGGTDDETDDELRSRILERIQQPPMGGDANDYVQWALAVPGVTRAWCYPLEMGIGTVTVRFVMDDVRADNDGFPYEEDVAAVEQYINMVRPVAVKDVFVEAPIKQPISCTITELVPDTPDIRSPIETSLRQLLRSRRTWADDFRSMEKLCHYEHTRRCIIPLSR